MLMSSMLSSMAMATSLKEYVEDNSDDDDDDDDVMLKCFLIVDDLQYDTRPRGIARDRCAVATRSVSRLVRVKKTGGELRRREGWLFVAVQESVDEGRW
jgi:hypothetical protein